MSTPNHRIICGDALEILPSLTPSACVFADPPDNIGLRYNGCADNRPAADYLAWIESLLVAALENAPIVWLSFNARWSVALGVIGAAIQARKSGLEIKPCVQTFTFGQHDQRDLASCHRPLWRFRRDRAPLYPDAIRVSSWRQENGDKRADPRGRVPGDVFDFPRVTGNSKQRRAWHPTQLHEGLVERCILLSTKPGELVCDPCAGTGTTGRVCRRIDRRSVLIDCDPVYCQRMGDEQAP